MLATRPHHQTAKPLTLYKRLPLENKEFQALFMLKPLFIKRKQLNFQKHIDRAKTNPARQSPRAGLFARRSAPSRRFCARAGARCVSVRPAGARAIPPATCCCTTNWMSIKKFAAFRERVQRICVARLCWVYAIKPTRFLLLARTWQIFCRHSPCSTFKR